MFTVISNIVYFLLRHLPCTYTDSAYENDTFAGNSRCGLLYRSAFVMEMEIFEIHLFGLVLHASLTEGGQEVKLRRLQEYDAWHYAR